MRALRKTVSRREFLETAALTTAGSVLAACAPKPEEPPAAAPTTAKAEATPVPEPGGCQIDWNPTFPPATKHDPPIQISTVFEDSAQFLGQDNWTNNPMYNRVKEQLGIEYTIHWQGSGDVATQKWNADIAAGTLADMLYCWSALESARLIDNGAVEDITEIWDKTASPLVKEKRERDHPMWASVTRGDRIYGVPWTNGPAHNIAMIPYVREDWLSKLGLQPPQTLEQMEQVAHAFIDAGLAKSGFAPGKDLITWVNSMDPVFGAYGVMPRAWLPDGNGGLEYGSVNPKVKEVLSLLNRWYKEGLLDPDFYTVRPSEQKAFDSGRVGFAFNPWWKWSASYMKVEADNPGCKIATLDLPKGPEGKQGRKDSSDHGSSTLFRKGLDPAKIEAALEHLNWSVEMHVNWEKYQQYGEWRNSHAFVEGYEWQFDENCELKQGPIDNTYGYMAQVGFSFPCLCYPSYQADIFRDMLKWYEQDPATLNKAQRYLMQNPAVKREAETYLRGVDEAHLELTNRFFGVPTQNILDLMPDLDTLESQVYIEIIIGNRPLEAFDQYVSDFEKNGGDKVAADVNAWYATQKSS